MTARRLATNPVHLGLGATAEPEPEFTGIDWYADYISRHAADGDEARLVSQFAFSESWDAWEMHPRGAEVVICTRGRIALIQEFPDGRVARTSLAPGDYAINPPGIWHTADVEGDAEAEAIFITAGAGTEHRTRSDSDAPRG